MHIILGIMRHIVIDHQRQIGHIDTTGHYIGSHQHIHLAVPEVEHHLIPFVLLQVTMHRARIYM